MTESLRKHVQHLADYLNDEALEGEGHVTVADILDALATYGITLVEDPVMDSTMSYQEELA